MSMTQEWVPEDPDELFAKTVEQLIREMPEGVAIQVYNRVDKGGEPYLMVHGRGEGAALLQRVLLKMGVIKGSPNASVVKRTKA